LICKIIFLQTTRSGAMFWSGPKRCPHALTFDPENVSVYLKAQDSWPLYDCS